MRIFPLLLLFLLIYIEAQLFIAVAGVFGVALTLLLIIATSFMGISLVRSQGIKTLMQLQQKMATGENPASEMIKSVSLLFAGFLLLIPGFFTDFLGLLLMLPFVQKLMTLRMMPFVQVYQPSSFRHYTDTDKDSNIIEGEFKRKDDE